MNKIAAVKRYRALTDCSLRRAIDDVTDIIEALDVDESSTESSRLRGALNASIHENEELKRRLEAIEVLARTLPGYGTML